MMEIINRTQNFVVGGNFIPSFFVCYFLAEKGWIEIHLFVLLQVNQNSEAWSWLALHVGSSEIKSSFLFLTLRE